MLQSILTIAKSIAVTLNARDLTDCERWQSDPLAHPALLGMNERDIADLPIGNAVEPRLDLNVCR